MSFKEDSFPFDSTDYVGRRKVQKFFRITIPILIIEALAILGLGAYLLFLPKNYCKISCNIPEAVIYINNKETNKFRMETPQAQTEFYFYEVDVSIMLPGTETYEVAYVLNSDKYQVIPKTSATQVDNTYKMTIVGGEKTQLLSAITMKSPTLSKHFDVTIEITAIQVNNV